MSKKKKGKVVAMKPTQLSPEKYIKTQARTLPVFECLINDDWETSGLCNVVVARQHKNGNITAGIYLVDMFCLGIKGAQYEFNLYQDDYEDLKNRFNWERCDYVLAHNIIFGAIAYAEDYGFKPHKEFETEQYILEEDDEAIELMELDFGLNGKPHYVSGPYDDAVKVNNIIATLERTAGEGNFTYTYLGDGFDDMDDDDLDDWDEDDYDDYDIDYPNDGNELGAMLKLLKNVSETYDAKIRTEQARQILSERYIGAKYELSETEGALENNRFDSDEEAGDYYRLRTIIANKEIVPVKEFEDARLKYPATPAFYNLLQTAYINNQQYDEAEDTITLMYNVFPDYFPSLINYAGMLFVHEEPEAVLAVFNGKPDLNYLYPHRKVFHVGEALVYYACMCRYFSAIDQIDSADMYMNAMLKYAETDLFKQTELAKFAIMDLFKAKFAALTEGGFLGK
ncbi:hypothetical protein [Mucilaginibacter sp. SJ]|uniref:hypothetical protein n=1 Tax=Mucilaginibacter sp. SJ TaxID=3029053 RepID=UPI0023A98CC1|nr:hypothetical protein [Mucilaginibacter sp. SJ]WDZ98650.1 hypothetical protein MusilaSJ_14320 [Mucilaginibacter sp. SJ]